MLYSPKHASPTRRLQFTRPVLHDRRRADDEAGRAEVGRLKVVAGRLAVLDGFLATLLVHLAQARLACSVGRSSVSAASVLRGKSIGLERTHDGGEERNRLNRLAETLRGFTVSNLAAAGATIERGCSPCRRQGCLRGLVCIDRTRTRHLLADTAAGSD